MIEIELQKSIIELSNLKQVFRDLVILILASLMLERRQNG